MAHRDIVVVGASAGGVEALGRLAASLPEDLQASVMVVLHIPPEGTSLLPSILSRSGRLPAAHARSGEPLRYGRIYIAPPNRHLMLHDGHARLSSGPRENGHRPAVDTLFRSAARAGGRRTIGVVLSGALDDGAAGLAAIRTRGGLAVAQEPQDALYPAMPVSAIDQVGVDHVAAAADMGELQSALTKESLDGGAAPVPDTRRVEVEMPEMPEMTFAGDDAKHPGRPSGFSCPDCNGVLWEIEEDEIFRFRCRVGHEWSPQGLLAQQNDGIEAALWIALRSLEERASLSRRLARPPTSAGTRSQPAASTSRRRKRSTAPPWFGRCWRTPAS